MSRNIIKNGVVETTSKEPSIIINGVQLTSEQAMTVRIAVAVFTSQLHYDSMAKTEEQKFQEEEYKRNLYELRKLIMRA